MAQDSLPRIRPDPDQVRMGRNFEIRYWMQVFGVSREALEQAVLVVGHHAEAVRRYLLDAEVVEQDRRRGPPDGQEASMDERDDLPGIAR